MHLEFTDDFVVENLGEQENWVYDIEVDKCHNFFGNDILLHNSLFFSFDFVTKNLKNKDPKEITESLNKFSVKFIEPELNNIFNDLANYLNVNENKMVMEREKIMEKFLIIGKKRYTYLLWDNEGVRYDEPQLGFTGVEVVRSSTPNIIKPYLKESLKKIMIDGETGIKQYISEVKEKFFEMSPEDIAFPRSVSDVAKYTDRSKMFKKGCPIAVRSAIIFNNYVKKYNLNFPQISDGEKIKFLYMITPNNFFNSNVFGFANKIPDKELVEKFVDYHTQFQKVYFDVIKNITVKLGYDLFEKKQNNLDELF